MERESQKPTFSYDWNFGNWFSSHRFRNGEREKERQVKSGSVKESKEMEIVMFYCTAHI